MSALFARRFHWSRCSPRHAIDRHCGSWRCIATRTAMGRRLQGRSSQDFHYGTTHKIRIRRRGDAVDHPPLKRAHLLLGVSDSIALLLRFWLQRSPVSFGADRRSPIEPPTSRSAARNSEYASMTHWTPTTVACRSFCNVGNATFTTVPFDERQARTENRGGEDPPCRRISGTAREHRPNGSPHRHMVRESRSPSLARLSSTTSSSTIPAF